MKTKEFNYLAGALRLEIKMSKTARFDCDEFGFSELVVKETPTFAESYLQRKAEGDRFTIVDTDLKMVVTGVVTYRDGNEVELLITNVNGDVELVKSGRYRDYAEF